jgi:hypothetical protein
VGAWGCRGGDTLPLHLTFNVINILGYVFDIFSESRKYFNIPYLLF